VNYNTKLIILYFVKYGRPSMEVKGFFLVINLSFLFSTGYKDIFLFFSEK
jgi:hypothetical protein